VALIHGVGASSDLRSGGLRLLAIGCAMAVGGAGLWRLTQAAQEAPRAERAAAVLADAQPPARLAPRPYVHDREAR
jgi:hypothetical protein